MSAGGFKDMELVVTDKVEMEDEKRIAGGVMEYNRERMDRANGKEIGVYLRGEAGRPAAGLTGYTHGEWMFVKWLWVSPSLRGQDVGSAVLKKAEDTARERGCRYSFLDTFEFQAPEFYKKYGYEEVMVIQEHPATGKHYYLKKTL